MDIPYLLTQQETVACIVRAEADYGIPMLLIEAVYLTEGGKVGHAVRNTNGSYDVGPMQINWGKRSTWGRYFERSYGLDIKRLAWDPCANFRAGAYVLRKSYNKTGDWDRAVAVYHAGSETKENANRRKKYARTVARHYFRLRAAYSDGKYRTAGVHHAVATIVAAAK